MVGRSEKDFIFYFIFILFLVDTLSNNDLSLKFYTILAFFTQNDEDSIGSQLI